MQYKNSVQSMRIMGRGIALGMTFLVTAPTVAMAQALNDPRSGSTLVPDLAQSLRDPFEPAASPTGAGINYQTTRTVDPSVYADEAYLLGSGDVIQVEFFNVPEMSGTFQVLPNGTVNLPQLGSIAVRGRTIPNAEQVIETKAAAILRYPEATVSLDRARPISVAIAGEVTSPGTYTLRPGDGTTAGTIPSLSETLKLAQGVTQSADLNRVIIRRPNPLSGTISQVEVNLWQLIERGDINQDLRLRDGDSVIVPAVGTIDLDVARRMSDIAFATSPDRPIKIAVIGEVNRPGPYTLTSQASQNLAGNTISLEVPTITRAIQTAGGITQVADVRNITVTRKTRSGTVLTRTVNFWELLRNGDAEQDLPLQDGDTIQIATATEISDEESTELGLASFSPNEISVTVAGEVVRPGVLALNPNTPINEALLTAGGFNGRANTKKMTLLRLNRNGTVMQKELNVDLNAGLDSEKNPPLRDGDTIVIARSRLNAVGGILRAFTGPIGAVNALLRMFGRSGYGARTDDGLFGGGADDND